MEMVANQAAKPLKKGGKKNNNHQFWNSRIAGSLSCSVTPLASSPGARLEPCSGGTSRSLMEQLYGKPVELGPGSTRGAGFQAGHDSSPPMWSWGPAEPEGWGTSGVGVLVGFGSCTAQEVVVQVGCRSSMEM
jgi:hypothetical protein